MVCGRSAVMPIEKNRALFYGADYIFRYGKSDELLTGSDCYIVTYGNLVGNSLAAAEILSQKEISCGVINAPCPLDLDDRDFIRAFDTKAVLVAEDHNVESGLFSVLTGRFFNAGGKAKLLCAGITDYCGSDDSRSLYKKAKLDAESLARQILKNIEK